MGGGVYYVGTIDKVSILVGYLNVPLLVSISELHSSVKIKQR